jgi:hypothetical protein
MCQETRVCIYCKKDKPLNAYTFDKGYYHKRCKECAKDIVKLHKLRKLGIAFCFLHERPKYFLAATKQCTDCKKEYPIEEFKQNKRFLSSYCKSCLNKKAAIYRSKPAAIEKIKAYRKKLWASEKEKIRVKTDEFREKSRIRIANWRNANRARFNEIQRVYREKHHEKYLIKANLYWKKAIKNLDDSYLKAILSREGLKNIPQEVLEVKRLVIQLKRKLGEHNEKCD